MVVVGVGRSGKWVASEGNEVVMVLNASGGKRTLGRAVSRVVRSSGSRLVSPRVSSRLVLVPFRVVSRFAARSMVISVVGGAVGNGDEMVLVNDVDGDSVSNTTTEVGGGCTWLSLRKMDSGREPGAVCGRIRRFGRDAGTTGGTVERLVVVGIV